MSDRMSCHYRIVVWGACVSALLFGLMWMGSTAHASGWGGHGGKHKTNVCHVSADGSQHELKVSVTGLRRHLKHHPNDTKGECSGGGGNMCDDPGACDDGDPCTFNFCHPVDGCSYEVLRGASCDDGSMCTSGDVCGQDGTCAGTPDAGCCFADADCADGDWCTTEICNSENQCVAGGDVVCPEAPACELALCDPLSGACENAPVSCDDGDMCTTDSCQGDACMVGSETSDTCLNQFDPSNATESPESSCEDGLDNDCDGLVDADDEDCSSCVGFPPVCGSDGETYQNECFAEAAGVSVEHEGECDSSSCVGFPPVCGSDGETYQNECFAEAAGVEVEHAGECES